jgi:GLPGLI family protein
MITLIQLFVCYFLAGGENYVASYSYSIQRLNSTPQSYATGRALLVLTEEGSWFLDEAKYARDTLQGSSSYQKLNADGKRQALLGLQMPQFNFTVFKSAADAKVYYSEAINRHRYTYVETIPQISWQLGSDTARVAGYLCRNAQGEFGGRQYTAWFSIDLPWSDGPYKLGGLPGLILHLEDKSGQLKFSLIGFEKVTSPPSLKSKFTSLVTRKEFEARRDHYYMNRQEYRDANSRRQITVNGKVETMDEFYAGIKEEYLDRVLWER